MPWGRDNRVRTVVEQIIARRQAEPVRLDLGALDALYAQLGEANAEDVVCRAIEELAVRLSHCGRLWCAGDIAPLRKSARSLVAIADQIGMCQLAQVARDVTATIDAGDDPATAATLSRLMHVGERSLTAVWDAQHLSI
ncbi:MAG: hypothetical protein NXH82_08660 [Rhodobacteraceae bacterium]|nr:hypothetical protein [Paracoccaceae bacterium]